MPKTNCLAMASPPTMLVSDSTHMPPTGTNVPSDTFFRTRAYTSGRCSLSQASCWAWLMANTKSGWSAISAVTFAAVRATLRTVSRSGHSHAESMCACPTALSRCAEACAGEASTPARRSLAAGAEPAMSARSSASSAPSTARSSVQRSASSTASSFISPPTTSRSCTSSQTCSSKTVRSTRRRWYSGVSPAVGRSLKPSSLCPSMTGLAAAST